MKLSLPHDMRLTTPSRNPFSDQVVQRKGRNQFCYGNHKQYWRSTFQFVLLGFRSFVEVKPCSESGIDIFMTTITRDYYGESEMGKHVIPDIGSRGDQHEQVRMIKKIDSSI